jgi:hypothetical protein
MSDRIKRCCFPVTLSLAALFTLLVTLGLGVSVPPSSTFFGRLAYLLTADASMRKTLLAAALGLTLTAFLFFRKPARRPIRFTRTLDV